MNGEMTFEEAKELTVLKWQFIVDNDCKTDCLDDLIYQYELPEKLEEYIFRDDASNECAMCEKYRNLDFIGTEKECIKCPLSIGFNTDNGIACFTKNHPYSNWDNNPSVETAQAVLDLVKNCKPLK